MVENAKASVTRIILVYDAELSLLGSLQYLKETLSTGNEPCSLCAITHNAIFEKPAWKAGKFDIGIEINALYRNQLTPEMENEVAGDYPAVMIELSDGKILKILGREMLESCAGDPQAFVSQLQAAVSNHP
ncbi:MAG: hypothetical protein QNJ46_04340 [Leptolyngbyaceae cyanobacterium MO_188.B28]|nr:hypothetical protein [Leptolyngbyaceae cyanobacterium MO_188.B28]